MKKYAPLISALLVVSIHACTTRASLPEDKELNVMAYYYAGWKQHDVEKLQLDKLTHIIYSFTEVIDNEMKFKNDSSALVLKNLLEQRERHPHLKVMIACGGWGGSGGFSDMARSEENRRKFVESAVRFLEEYQLDGLDIDWEYPGMKGIGNPFIPEDKENFTALMRELREGMDKLNDNLILTFAVAGWERFFDHVELDKVMPYADYMNIMSYDLAGGGDSYTSHHTNLGWVKMEDIEGTPAADKIRERGDLTKPFSAEKIIAYCMDKGIKAEQIVIGAAFYGKGWIGVPPDNNGLYQLNKGQWTGMGSYANLRQNFEDKGGFVRYWDPVAKAPYLYNPSDSIFISYEDTVSIRLKTDFALKNGLGGIMFWQLRGDTDKKGLLDAIYAEKMRVMSGK
ncbi:glycoside hydrolase family 18 protein [Negadavirga shengliensis]|uniref:chitinase n=1 Tax=Negadavirga shengliensis TaxID=1389218 RepID=A0ABV9T0E3_9BACT